MKMSTKMKMYCYNPLLHELIRSLKILVCIFLRHKFSVPFPKLVTEKINFVANNNFKTYIF